MDEAAVAKYVLHANTIYIIYIIYICLTSLWAKHFNLGLACDMVHLVQPQAWKQNTNSFEVP